MYINYIIFFPGVLQLLASFQLLKIFLKGNSTGQAAENCVPLRSVKGSSRSCRDKKLDDSKWRPWMGCGACQAIYDSGDSVSFLESNTELVDNVHVLHNDRRSFCVIFIRVLRLPT